MLFLELKLLRICQVKSWPTHNYQCLRFVTTAHPHFSTHNRDMCHDTIGSGLIEIPSQLDWIADWVLIGNRRTYYRWVVNHYFFQLAHFSYAMKHTNYPN